MIQATDTPTSDPSTEVPARIGPPIGNFNALRNGSRSVRPPLPVLPRCLRRQEENCRKFRRELEAAVIAVRGQISLKDALLINEACVGELHSSVCAHCLRSKFDELSVADQIKCSEGIVRGKTMRNRAYEKLGLDTSEESTLAALYADFDQPDEASHVAQDAMQPDETSHEPPGSDNATEANCAKGGAESEGGEP